MSIKILTIDDSRTLRHFIAKTLRKSSEDYEIFTAQDGTEGLAIVRSEKPDLILLDLILPDFNGDILCRKLLEDPETSRIPIVMLSSCVADVKKTAQHFSNVYKTLAKPFTPELLCATVKFVLRENLQNNPTANGTLSSLLTKRKTQPLRITGRASEPQTTSDTGSEEPAAKDRLTKPLSKRALAAAAEAVTAEQLSLSLKGTTPCFSISQVLRALEMDALSGVLTLHVFDPPIEFYVKEGYALMATCQDVETYLQGAELNFPPDQQAALRDAMIEQTNLGRPFFLSLVEKDILTKDKAQSLVFAFGNYLFSRIWLCPSYGFEFHKKTAFPDFVASAEENPIPLTDWTMESLRQIQPDNIPDPYRDDGSGIPFYNRKGYERIPRYRLTEEEVALANEVDKGNATLKDIAGILDIPLELARAILFRFICVEIFDYWPGSSIQNQTPSHDRE